MREILFRAKWSDGTWVYGHYEGPCTGFEDWHQIKNDNLVTYRVDPETVGQFTGVVDENGVKIFDGDIVERFRYSEYRWLVEWDVDCVEILCNLYRPYKNRNILVDRIVLKKSDSIDIRIVGNRFDNPELLEVET